MWHSEFHQDEFVADLLGNKRGGTFVEFGALDGLLHSNTLYFEYELGWTGLLIEANPEAYSKLYYNRPGCVGLNVAIYDHDGAATFRKIKGGHYGWSGIEETLEERHRERIDVRVPATEQHAIRVNCWTLAHALDWWGETYAPYAIDYMSIDVEGAEEKILRAFPFERFNIDVLGVEDNFGNVELDALIQDAGFEFLRRCGPDRMYRKMR